MAVKLSPVFNFAQYSGANPLTGALLFTYVAGSSTKANTYQDSAGNTAHSNPIVLNSRGEPPAPIWLTVGVTYDFVLAPSTDSDPPVAPIRNIDDVTGVNDTTLTIDQWVAGPAPTYVSATSFTLVGDQTSTFHVGRRVKTTNSGGTVYSTITASAFGASTTVTVVNDSGTLDSGLSAVSYGLLSAVNPSTPNLTTGSSASTFTFNGSGGTSSSVTMRWQKFGGFVTLHLPAVSATTGTSSTTFTGDTALPALLRPLTDSQEMPINDVLDNTAAGATAGTVTISTAGVIVIRRTGSATAWTNAATGGTAEGNTFTYYVGTGS